MYHGFVPTLTSSAFHGAIFNEVVHPINNPVQFPIQFTAFIHFDCPCSLMLISPSLFGVGIQ